MSIETWLSASRARLESPPLVRERQVLQFRSLFSVGITPAHVGKTSPKPRIRISAGDHPRSCGKDKTSNPRKRINGGSPPLVRERQGTTLNRLAHIRITPARAGKTAGDRAVSTACRDHPRSCGKDSTGAGLSRPPSGSPPLVRERLTRIGVLPDRNGITPARAGKTYPLYISVI